MSQEHRKCHLYLLVMKLSAPSVGRADGPRRAALRRLKTAVLSGWLIALLAVGFIASPFGSAQSQTGDRPVILIDLRSAIGFVAAEQLARALEQATAQGSPAVIVRLDTPGGLLTSTREIVHSILASRIPIIMYVAPNGSRAASAGTYLMYASHVAAMAPSTHLGAATPIALAPMGHPGSPPKQSPGSDKEPPSDTMTVPERKSVNDAVAYIRSLAELRNRNADWAEKAVREAATLTASAALRERVIDVIAKDIDELMSQIDGRSVATAAGEIRLETKGRRILELRPDWKMQVMSIITDPNIALILLMIGIYGILFEFWSPGAVAPGVVGGISLIVALTALSVLPINLGGLALLLFGVALMVTEAFNPGVGIAGLGGIVAFGVGALFLFDPAQSDIPIAISWQVLAGMTIFSAAFFAGILGFAFRSRQRPVRTGAEQMIGSVGEVVSWTENEGRVLVNGEMWAARSVRSFESGQRIRIVSRTDLMLSVEASN